MELVERAIGKTAVLGVCLGHQAIVLQAGGEVARAPEPVHGKASLLRHDGAGPFRGVDSFSPVGRYHSLHTRNLPGRFTVHAEAEGIVMAISDAQALQWGLQFHPESILTRGGDRMLQNILADSERDG
jgi:anthranilate synthase/aminodeoxychorismate synthase-like glutamine amidotransferase